MFWCRYNVELPLVYDCGAGHSAETGLRTRQSTNREQEIGENMMPTRDNAYPLEVWTAMTSRDEERRCGTTKPKQDDGRDSKDI
jgi:hypothetical protein